MTAITKIQIRRGNVDDIPTLDSGELAFTLDTHELYAGSGLENYLIGGAGSAGFFYTNAEIVPINIGGIDAGASFSNIPMDELWDSLLYDNSAYFIDFYIQDQVDVIEVGDYTQISTLFMWSTANSENVSVNSITIEDVTNNTILADLIDNNGSKFVMTGNIQKTSPQIHIWGISGIDNNQNIIFQKNYTVSWRWCVYYGNTSDAGSLSAVQIKALHSKELKSNYQGTYHVQSTGYKYIAYPSSMGTANLFKDSVTGHYIPFIPYYEVEIMNDFSCSTLYKVHRTVNKIGVELDIQVVVA